MVELFRNCTANSLFELETSNCCEGIRTLRNGQSRLLELSPSPRLTFSRRQGSLERACSASFASQLLPHKRVSMESPSLSAALDASAEVVASAPQTRYIGLALAISSSVLIGTSFIITKKVRLWPRLAAQHTS